MKKTPGLVSLDKDITPADTGTAAKFGNEPANCFWIETTGPVVTLGHDGVTHTYPGALGGMWHNVAPFVRVNDTGTTATTVKVGVTY